MNLAPALHKENIPIWIMDYPNDQPIVDSARFFSEELKRLSQKGIERIVVVAHSMGGLVAREMLTRADIKFEEACKVGRVPMVSGLIMVGTPNHGSQMARLRILAEIRDQFIRLTTGDFQWLGAVFDGAGEARIDLLPGSRFLTELNNRPHPSGVRMLVIAGRVSPWREEDIERFFDEPSSQPNEAVDALMEEAKTYMHAMTRGLGDGLVTVDSARLSGIPLETVAGTHLSMIRNLAEDSARVPPATPIIVDRVKRWLPDTAD
jgi:pimeloyl-ACP methyl ester carboxylesterase